jgi:hypothetical protein
MTVRGTLVSGLLETEFERWEVGDMELALVVGVRIRTGILEFGMYFYELSWDYPCGLGIQGVGYSLATNLLSSVAVTT